jgi:tripartite-type tricarboxylate transporter receptor subunit TctC
MSAPTERAAGAASDALRLIVGFSEGSASSIVARMIAPVMSRFLDRPVSIVRMPGENGALCAEHVARAAPDGNTLGIAIQTHAIGPLLQAHSRYDPIADFAPVALIAKWPMMLAVSNRLGVRSIAEFIALARSRPGKLVYGASATGGSPHLAAMLFCAMAGIEMELRVYSETDALYTDLAEGVIAATFNNTMSVLPLARAGRLQLLATAGLARSAAAPDVPTIAEAAFPGYEVVNWIGIVAPAATSSEIVARVNAAVVRTVHSPQVRKMFEEHGMEPVVAGPDAFARHLGAEIDRWGELIAANRSAFPSLR